MTLGSLLYGIDSIETIHHSFRERIFLIQDCPSEYSVRRRHIS
jgi:hypothetical protein